MMFENGAHDDTTGGFFDSLDIGSLINTGVKVGVGLLAGNNGPKNDCNQRASGNDHMSRCVPLWMAKLDQLYGEVPQLIAQGVLADTIVAQAQAIASVFSDDAWFDQGIGGESRTIRENAKTTAAQKVAQITALAQQEFAAIGGGHQTVQQQVVNGQVVNVPVTTAQLIPGIDNTTVLIGLAGLFVVLLIRD